MEEILLLKEQINHYKYVSFDIFDTLLFRSVQNPSDLFCIVENIYNGSHKKSIKNFHWERQVAETKARNKKGSYEVTFDEIYNEFNNLDAQEISDLKNIELECELKCAIPNKPMIDLTSWSKKQGKTVLITSDIYLPRELIEKLLNKVGAEFDRLYISCESGFTKESGRLFEYISESGGVPYSEMIHIGDNSISDLKMPLKNGIASAIRVVQQTPNSIIESYFNDSPIEKHLECLTERYYLAQNYILPQSFKLGFEIVGPFLFGFCEWLYKKVSQYKIDELYFVAREGYLIKSIFNIIYPTIRTKYIRFSTRALNKDLAENNGRLFLRYLRQEGICGEKIIGLVNNSINGTGQNNIEKIILGKENTVIIGLQFVSSKQCLERLNDRFVDISTDLSFPSQYSIDLQRCCLVMENIFFENKGTALSFVEDKGEVSVVCHNQISGDNNYKIISWIQQGAIEFANTYAHNLNLNLSICGFSLFRRFLMSPRYQDALLFEKVYDEDIKGINKLVDGDRSALGLLFRKKRTDDVIWYEGTLVIKNLRKLICIYHLRLRLKYYLLNRKDLAIDIKFYFNIYIDKIRRLSFPEMVYYIKVGVKTILCPAAHKRYKEANVS